MEWVNRVVDAIRPKASESTDADDVVQMERDEARRVVDLAMRVAEAMLTVGASVNDVTAAALQILKAYDVSPAHVDVMFTSITVSFHRDIDQDPLTLSRVVRARTTDFTRAQRLDQLVQQIEDGLDVDVARVRFVEIISAPHPYRRAIVTLAHGGLAAGVSVALGASWPIIIAATVATMLIAVVQHELGRRLLPAFFTQAVGGLVVTLVAMLMIIASRELQWIDGVRPSIVVAAGIVMMLAGMAVVGAAQDAIDGFHVTAAARTFEVIILTLGIVVGIAAGLKVASMLGYGFLLTSSAPPMGGIDGQFLGAALIAAAYALSTYSTMRTILLAAVTALVSWGGFLFGSWLGLGVGPASAIGSMVASFLGILVARRLHVPSLALMTAAIIPLVPGAAVFRGLLQLIDADGSSAAMMTGFSTLLGAAGVGLALAAGVSLGAYFGRPTRDTITTAVRRLRGAA